MGSYIDNYKAVADYILTYDEFKKVVPEEMALFEEKANELLVFLKLQGYEYDMSDVLEYLIDEEESSEIEMNIDGIDGEIAKQKIEEMFDLMGKAEEKFQEKTKISIYLEYSKVSEEFYFEMRMDDVVQLTPQAKELQDSGIKFGFQSWVDEW